MTQLTDRDLIGSLEREIALRNGDLEQLRITLEEELAGKHEVLLTVHSRESEQQEAIDQLGAEVHRIAGEIADLAGRLAAHEASVSWRITAPLRAVSSRARKLSGRAPRVVKDSG